MTSHEPPHAIYRYRDGKDHLLYIGRTNDPMRRTNEHWRRKDWITSAARIDLEWVPAHRVHELERLAIQSEHPRYNIQHNSGRIKIEVSAEVSVPSGDGLVALVAISALAIILGKWGFEGAANWSVKRRAERAGMTIDLPPVPNPFKADQESWPVKLLYASMAAAAAPRLAMRTPAADEPSSAAVEPSDP
jgi:predicted GIY-YIG superfamily endonuclease